MNHLKTVKVGLGSCGIAAGAQEIYDQLLEFNRQYPDKIILQKTNCIGLCYKEPLLQIEDEIYGNVTLEKLNRIIESHILKNIVLKDEVVYSPHFNATENAFLNTQTKWALRNCGYINPENIEDYEKVGGYQAILKIQTWSHEQIINEIIKSGLRGRGGGGFPTGVKWQYAEKQSVNPKYIICNADEGDPGAFMDRSILEGDPHSIIEGLLIAGYAIGAHYGVIYCRAEYPLAIKRLRIAIAQAESKQYLGKNACGIPNFDFKIQIKEGAGAFVCGEETALIASIEGHRGMPRKRPPFPAEQGLYNQPTTINNVETLANIPAIILKGADAYQIIGTEKSKGTKVFALTGKIKHSGLVEVPMGTSIRKIIEEIGGGVPNGKKLKAVQLGGPSGGCIPAHLLDTIIDYDALKQIGTIMGSGGMVVMDESTCMIDIAKFFLNFTQNESCGKCTFCRIGTLKMLEILEGISTGKGEIEDLDRLEFLAKEIKNNSLCGLGQSAPNPVLSTLKYFREEYEAHILHKKCPALQCEALIHYEIIQNQCVGCGQCLKHCPVNAIEGSPKCPHRINIDQCIKCGQCLKICKFKAIHKI